MSVMYDSWYRMKSEPCERTQTGDAALCLLMNLWAQDPEAQWRGVLKEHTSRLPRKRTGKASLSLTF